MSDSPGSIILENYRKEREKHSALCNINDGLCGECVQKYNEWKAKFEARKPLQQREIEALDRCISSQIGESVAWQPGAFYVNEVQRRFEAISEQEKEDRRDAWRKKFYKKFAMNDNWDQMDVTFWDWNTVMMEGAKVVYEKKMANAAQVTPVEKTVEKEATAEVTPVEKAVEKESTAEVTPVEKAVEKEATAEVTPVESCSRLQDGCCCLCDWVEVREVDMKE